MKLSKFNIIMPIENKNKYILFNTLSGSTFLLDKKDKDLVESCEILEIDNELRKNMIEKRVIVDDNIDENKYFKYFREKSKYTGNTLSLTLLLTWACNLRCVYCYEGAGEKKSYSMTKETANNIILFIKNEIKYNNIKNVGLMLFGGEPLVNFSIGKYILDEVHKFCNENEVTFITSIITNGTLLTKDIIDTLVIHNCKYTQITLDGTKEIHDNRRIAKDGSGTFDEIINSLKLLKNFTDKMNVVIRVNIDKTNTDNIDELLKILKDEELTSLHLDFGIVRGGTEACSSYESKCYNDPELGLLMNKLWKKAEEVGFNAGGRPSRRWTYCGVEGENSFTIEPNGDVYKCWEHVGDIEHKMSRINSEGQMDGFNYNFYEWMTKDPLNVEECRKCAYLPACGGGCGSISYAESNKYEAEGCFKVKGVIEEQIKRYFKEKIDNIC